MTQQHAVIMAPESECKMQRSVMELLQECVSSIEYSIIRHLVAQGK